MASHPNESVATDSNPMADGSAGFAEPLTPALLLDAITARPVADGAVSEPDPAVSGVAAFINGELGFRASLRLWLGSGGWPDGAGSFDGWKKQAARRLAWHVAEIDRLLADQLNAVLHEERFQKLEAAWRGLRMLVDAVPEDGEPVLLRVLNVSWKELQRDFERASEFDQSELFRKVYEQEFGSPGGIPFSALIGDYEIHPRPSTSHPFDDVAILGQVAAVAAAAFCPFVAGASPSLFGVDSFLPLERSPNLAAGFESAAFVKWRSLRRSEDARFVGLTVPRILMRRPWERQDTTGILFAEDTSGATIGNYLWGNAAFAWGQVLIRSFSESGWLADIRGTERNRPGGGLVTSLPVIPFRTDRMGAGVRSSTDLIITDQQETEFSRLGFLPLCQCHDAPAAAFYSSQSIQEAATYDSPVASANARISTMLHYMLCVARFAHYLKVMARDCVGSVTEPEQLQDRLQTWLTGYVTPDEQARPEQKARRPLRQAEVSVSRDPGRPGSFLCSFSLLPHYQLDQLSASIRMSTSLAPATLR